MISFANRQRWKACGQKEEEEEEEHTHRQISRSINSSKMSSRIIVVVHLGDRENLVSSLSPSLSTTKKNCRKEKKILVKMSSTESQRKRRDEILFMLLSIRDSLTE